MNASDERPALSVIDIQWPGDLDTTLLAIEVAGYHRYWATEHHSPRQSGSPALLTALAAQRTTSLRVGTSGVLLNFYSPLKVAEDFRLLELFFPGRIDLGVAGGGPTGVARRALLDGRPEPDAARYAARVEELARLVRLEPSRSGGVDGRRIGPVASDAASMPEIWVCGMSERSAALAGRVGACFAYNEHARLNAPPGTKDEGGEVSAVYRRSFCSANGGRSRISVACFGFCASTGEEAERGWRMYNDKHDKALVPTFLGSAERCHDQLLAVAKRYGAEELAVQSITDDIGARIASYRLLAEAFELPRRRLRDRV